MPVVRPEIRRSPRKVVIRFLDALLRDTVASWVDSLPGYQVAGAVAGRADLIELCTAAPPDVAVVQLGSAESAELALISELCGVRPIPHVVGLHPALDPRSLLRLHRAGAKALVSSRHGLPALRAALGDTESASLARWRSASLAIERSDPAGLSAREVEILALTTTGCSVADIANALEISTHTVTNHKRHIFAKLNVHSRTQAAAEVGRLGLFRGPGNGRRVVVIGPDPSLTRREKDILGSIALGHSVRQTAQTLGIAVKTVQSEQRQLFSKLNACNRLDALTRARDLGLVD
jgi:DNA-binding NarL/FixJ family response regulator